MNITFLSRLADVQEAMDVVRSPDSDIRKSHEALDHITRQEFPEANEILNTLREKVLDDALAKTELPKAQKDYVEKLLDKSNFDYSAVRG